LKDKDNRAIKKIIEYIDDIAGYTLGTNYASFIQDKKTMSACAFGIMQIGELATELSDDIQIQNSAIPWNAIRGMRNRIVHGYESVDSMVLWDTIETSLPKLKSQLAGLIETK